MEPRSELGRVRWGLPDVAVAFGVGLVVSALAVLPWVAGDGIPKRDEVAAALAALFTQDVAVVAVLVLVSRRRGTGRPASDFGLRVRLHDLRWLFFGIALEIAVAGLLWPITQLDDQRQEVARILERAQGVPALLFFVGVVVVAPISEELLYRGALLRGLMRKTSASTAILVSALLFALVHLLGGLGSGPVIPGLFLLGLVSGSLAARTGDLSASIFLHAGFNLVSALFILA